MGAMGLKYVFFSLDSVKDGNDGVYTINGEEKNISKLTRSNYSFQHKITQK